MTHVVLESRVQVSPYDGLTFTCSVEEARDLVEQLLAVLPPEESVINTGGTFGFALEKREDDDE